MKISWAQVVNTVSITSACVATFASGNPTRLHASSAAMLMGSPLIPFVWSRYVRWCRDERGPGDSSMHQTAIGAMLLTLFAWSTLVLCALSPAILFSQDVCGPLPWIFQYYPLPLTLPFVFYNLPLVLAEACRRKILDPKLGFFKTFASIWCVYRYFCPGASVSDLWLHRSSFEQCYPLIHALAHIVIPFLLWVAYVEVSLQSASPHENTDWFSFGQVRYKAVCHVLCSRLIDAIYKDPGCIYDVTTVVRGDPRVGSSGK